MATIRQKRAFDKVVENRGNVSRAMLEVGYPPTTAKNPKNLTESLGWQELCEEHGLTDNFLVKALVADIKAKPKNRTAELALGFKIKGRMNEEVKNVFNTLIINDEQASIIARRQAQDGGTLRKEGGSGL